MLAQPAPLQDELLRALVAQRRWAVVAEAAGVAGVAEAAGVAGVAGVAEVAVKRPDVTDRHSRR